MLHRLRQRASTFKGHTVARGGINKWDAPYVGITAPSRGLRLPLELPQTHNCADTGWKLPCKTDADVMETEWEGTLITLQFISGMSCMHH